MSKASEVSFPMGYTSEERENLIPELDEFIKETRGIVSIIYRRYTKLPLGSKVIKIPVIAKCVVGFQKGINLFEIQTYFLNAYGSWILVDGGETVTCEDIPTEETNEE